MNSKFALCNRLHIYGNRLPTISQRFNSNFKACNRLHTYCNRLPEEFFWKHSQQSHLFIWFLNGHQRLIYMWLETRISQEFFRTKRSYPLKKQNRFILLKIPWPNTCDSIRNYLSAQIVQSISFKRDYFFSSSLFWKGIKRPRVSCCERILNTKEGLSLCV